MLKKTIRYEDFDGNKQELVAYFNLTKPELVELDVSFKGGMEAWGKKIMASGDHDTMIREFKRIILAAYGEKSEDGQSFIKNDALREAFANHAAFHEYFFQVGQNEDAMLEFVRGVLPKDMAAKVTGRDQDKPKGPPRPPSSK